MDQHPAEDQDDTTVALSPDAAGTLGAIDTTVRTDTDRMCALATVVEECTTGLRGLQARPKALPRTKSVDMRIQFLRELRKDAEELRENVRRGRADIRAVTTDVSLRRSFHRFFDDYDTLLTAMITDTTEQIRAHQRAANSLFS